MQNTRFSHAAFHRETRSIRDVRRRVVGAAIVALAIGFAFRADHVRAASPTTAPAVTRSPREIGAALAADQAIVNDVLGKNNASLKTPELRAAAAPKLTPPLQRMIAGLDQLADAMPDARLQLAVSKLQLVAMLALLGDDASVAELHALQAGDDPSREIAYQAAGWLEQWYAAPADAAAQDAVVASLQTMDRAHPENEMLADLTARASKEAASPDVADRMLQIVAQDMDNSAATQVKHALAAKQAAETEDARVANKPLTLAGALPDGKPFTTASLKGKVVLVDFWATWCVPCVAELPRVKKLYETYHKDGLEVVGVSNDYDAGALTAFVTRQDMPWTQLFDAAAAKEHEWNAITRDQKIDGIPVMYLIDKRGVLRTVNARMNMEDLIPKLLAEPE